MYYAHVYTPCFYNCDAALPHRSCSSNRSMHPTLTFAISDCTSRLLSNKRWERTSFPVLLNSLV